MKRKKREEHEEAACTEKASHVKLEQEQELHQAEEDRQRVCNLGIRVQRVCKNRYSRAKGVEK